MEMQLRDIGDATPCDDMSASDQKPTSAPHPLMETTTTFERKSSYARRRRPLTGVDRFIVPRPFRAMTGYNRFVQEYFKKPLNELNGHRNLKSCGADWRSLTQLQKTEFSNRCAADRVRFMKEMDEWHILRDTIIKEPFSPFALFVKNFWAQEKVNCDRLHFGDIFEQMSQRWNNTNGNFVENMVPQDNAKQNGDNHQDEKMACLLQGPIKNAQKHAREHSHSFHKPSMIATGDEFKQNPIFTAYSSQLIENTPMDLDPVDDVEKSRPLTKAELQLMKMTEIFNHCMLNMNILPKCRGTEFQKEKIPKCVLKSRCENRRMTTMENETEEPIAKRRKFYEIESSKDTSQIVESHEWYSYIS